MAYTTLNSFPPMECLIAALAAASSGSFTHAAEDLGVSHAAISRRIAGAESWAGIKLFTRHARGVTVTTDGQRLLARVSQALDIVDQAADVWKKQKRMRTIRIATTHTFARVWLLPRLSTIEAKLGNARLEILTDARNVNLTQGEADFAIRYGRGNWKVGREQKVFEEEHLFAIVNTATWQRLKKPIRASDILSLPLIHNVDSTPWSTWAQAQGMAFRGRSVDRVMADNSLSIAAVHAGLGAAVLNAPIFSADNLPDGVCAITAKKAPCPLSYVLITPERELPEIVRAGAQLILALAAEQKQ
jgi:LysR family transcriptional regulator, glycine cleavage system transcriptional activator